jgi:hypothetical protein
MHPIEEPSATLRQSVDKARLNPGVEKAQVLPAVLEGVLDKWR